MHWQIRVVTERCNSDLKQNHFSILKFRANSATLKYEKICAFLVITVDRKSENIFSEPSVMAETWLHFCIFQRVDSNCQTGRFVFKLFSIINSMR